MQLQLFITCTSSPANRRGLWVLVPAVQPECVELWSWGPGSFLLLLIFLESYMATTLISSLCQRLRVLPRAGKSLWGKSDPWRQNLSLHSVQTAEMGCSCDESRVRCGVSHVAFLTATLVPGVRGPLCSLTVYLSPEDQASGICNQPIVLDGTLFDSHKAL